MGNRALVACHRERGVYDLYRSQWAGSESRTASVLAAVGHEPTSALLGCEWSSAGVASLSGLLKSFDYLAFDILYLVSASGVQVFYPVWLGVPTGATEGTRPTDGVLVRVESIAAVRALRRRCRRLKEFLGTGVETSVLTPSDARACLRSVFSSTELDDCTATA